MTDSLVYVYCDGFPVKDTEPMTHDQATQLFRDLRDMGANLDRYDMVYVETGRYASWQL